ncbi:MAG: hypothetical protein GMKNLPBB_02061 [Myxococcota bacterium]|nr:hypothetical protein [Myxococcota bacterium]
MDESSIPLDRPLESVLRAVQSAADEARRMEEEIPAPPPAPETPPGSPPAAAGAAMESEAEILIELKPITPDIETSKELLELDHAAEIPEAAALPEATVVQEASGAPVMDGPPPIRPQTGGSPAAALINELQALLTSFPDEVQKLQQRTGGKGLEIGARMLASLRDSLSTLSPQGYSSQWGAMGMSEPGAAMDEFGLDPVYEEKLQPFFDFLYYYYFRAEVSGIEKVPAQGRCMLVVNHSGALPYDAIMLRTAFQNDHPAQRQLRFLVEDSIFYFPVLGPMMSRVGGVRACQENGERLLESGQLISVFPEGLLGMGKLFGERYQLQRFGRGGFIKLALRTGTPIVPAAIVGAEEIHPLVAKLRVGRSLGLPFVPVTFTFPWLGPLGLMPFPAKWRIAFGDPAPLKQYSPADAEDPVLVQRLSMDIRGRVQELLNGLLQSRRSVLAG